MDRRFYYETVRGLQDGGVSPEYVQGWVAGYMRNPRREEQRSTEAYEAGYADGENAETGAAAAWAGR